MDTNNVGANNPIRWKSQYQDIETGLYFIEGRYYSPTLRQFISPMSADAMVSLCPMPNSLYPYSLSLTNPINSVYNSYSVDTFDGIVHDPESLSKFEYFWFIQVPRFWNSKVGKWLAIGLAAVAVVAAVVTTAVTGCLFAIKLLGGMTLSSGMLFMLTGAVFALASSNNGSSFWDNFVDYITNNWSQTLATLSISYIAALAFTALTSPDLCFKEGTLVETKEGLKSIEEIKEGDLVLAFDAQTGEQAFKPVVQLFRNTTDKWYHITANGEEIICTAEHPFFVVGLGFVPAKNLSITDKLLSSDNAIVDIDSISIETLSTPETTYNFEVAGFHTYYVGESGVLVHNTCKEWPPRRRKYWKQEAEELKGAGITYDNTPKNINRMKKGLAPLDANGRSVELHHVKGIKNDLDYVVQIRRSDHIRFHKTYGYRNFIDITLADDFVGLFV